MGRGGHEHPREGSEESGGHGVRPVQQSLRGAAEGAGAADPGGEEAPGRHMHDTKSCMAWEVLITEHGSKRHVMVKGLLEWPQTI